MKNREEPYVVAADRLTGSVIIAFRDGKYGLFTADLLYATLPQANQLDEVGAEEQETDKSEGL